MELREFIKAAISEVLAGVRDAQAENSQWVVAPRLAEHTGKPEKSEREVTFEVNVSTEIGAKGGLKLWSVVSGETSAKSTNVNKISFSVPVQFNAPKEILDMGINTVGKEDK